MNSLSINYNENALFIKWIMRFPRYRGSIIFPYYKDIVLGLIKVTAPRS